MAEIENADYYSVGFFFLSDMFSLKSSYPARLVVEGFM